VFSLGGSELLLIAVAALLLFGPDKIPQMARALGRFMREFNKYRDIMESTVRAEIYRSDEKGSDTPASDLDRMTKAADAVKDLVAAQEAKDAAIAAEKAGAAADTVPGAEETLHEAASVKPAHPADKAPLTVTDEDEEDGE
jgi:TatA/E family protein of Tat protein translocase